MASDEIKQAADDLAFWAKGSTPIIRTVESSRLRRWHQAMQALLHDRGSELASLTDRLNTALRECNSPLQAEPGDDLRPFVQALVDAARRQGAFWQQGEQPQQAWQPFTTAPTDGAEVLVYREDAGVFTAVYTYPVEEEAPDFDQGCWFTVGGEDLTGDPPSHWMPLPTGPDQQPQQVVPLGHVVVPVEDLRQAILAAATAAVDAVHLPGNRHEVVPIIPRLVAIEAGVKAGTAAMERRPTP